MSTMVTRYRNHFNTIHTTKTTRTNSSHMIIIILLSQIGWKSLKRRELA